MDLVGTTIAICRILLQQQLSIQFKDGPFRSLVRKKVQDPIVFGQSWRPQLFGPDLIKESEQKVKLISDRLKVAQYRQKSYANSKRKETVYEVGDRVYLCVSPLRVKRFGVKGKLVPRFVGPYKVLERMGEVAYKLELPEG